MKAVEQENDRYKDKEAEDKVEKKRRKNSSKPQKSGRRYKKLREVDLDKDIMVSKVLSLYISQQ